MHFSLPLPPHFRTRELIDFHGRDSHAVAERVSDNALSKALVYEGQPVLLDLIWTSHEVAVSVTSDQPVANPSYWADRVRHILGLNQDIEGFEKQFGSHPDLGPMIGHQRGLRIPQTATPFEALTWAVLGQQISLGAAVSLRRKLIQRVGLQAPGGLLCYPDTHAAVHLSVDDLRTLGISQSKARTLLTISEQVLDGRLPLDTWAQAWLQQFSPWRALVAAHVWAS